MRLGEQMYFKLEMNTIRDDLKISPKTCYATNTKDSSEKYYLVSDGYVNWHCNSCQRKLQLIYMDINKQMKVDKAFSIV